MKDRREMMKATSSWTFRLALAGFVALAASGPGHALAQAYPTKPIRLVLGFPPGGASDAGARIFAPKLGERLGQQIVVDNRPGANTNIANELVAHAQPDGHTLLWGFSNGLVVNPSLYDRLAFDVQRDFAPIMLMAQYQFILVLHRSVQAGSVRDLVQLVKAAKPGQFQYASTGIGSPNHLAAEMFKASTGIDITHVPYKGGGPAVVGVLSGETKMLFASIPSVLGHIKAGSLRALAVTAPKRAVETPEIPTMQELGFAGFDVRAWNGVLAPSRTPKNIVGRLHQELVKIMGMPDVQEGFRREGLEPTITTPEQFAARIRSETAAWSRLIKASNIRVE